MWVKADEYNKLITERDTFADQLCKMRWALEAIANGNVMPRDREYSLADTVLHYQKIACRTLDEVDNQERM